MSVEFVGRKPDTQPEDLFASIRDERDGVVKPIRFPWWQLNKGIGYGLLPGNLTVVAGPPGVAKSYFVLNAILAAHDAGFTWRHLPLEDDAQTWAMKFVAVRTNNWKLLAQPERDDDEERRRLGIYKEEILARHRDFIGELYDRYIAENPRVPIKAFGEYHALDVDYKAVLSFADAEAFRSNLIVVDPISQICFDPDGRDWRGQSDFLRKLAAIASRWKAHILLVAHTAKQSSRNGISDTLDGVQGSAMITRLAHNVITIARHDAMESPVYSSTFPTVEHKMTITLAKCRNGFSGTRYAFDMADQGPTFVERGLIKPKLAGRK